MAHVYASTASSYARRPSASFPRSRCAAARSNAEARGGTPEEAEEPGVDPPEVLMPPLTAALEPSLLHRSARERPFPVMGAIFAGAGVEAGKQLLLFPFDPFLTPHEMGVKY